ncbi:MAG: CBS domain-containing protein [Planctomycetes bacterium]|nr:CBS domain-containing protein [Planctomycetota bacterium]
MKVRELMTFPAHTCKAQDSLAHAARLMWDHDIGILPVVDREGRVGATITDRDICMAAWTRGARLEELRVADSMSKRLFACAPDDDVAVAAGRMVQHQVHRLPIVDGEGKLAGLLSLNDLAVAGEQDARIGREAFRALAGVCRRRAGVPAVPAPATTANAKAAPAGTTKAGRAPAAG